MVCRVAMTSEADDCNTVAEPGEKESNGEENNAVVSKPDNAYQ